MMKPCTSITRDEKAEFGTGSLVMFIAIMIAAAVISSIIVRIAEVAFDNKETTSERSTANTGAMAQIIRLEVIDYDPTNVATDSLMLNVDFPYLQNIVSDTSVSWVVACPALDANSNDHGFYFDRGDFSDVTELDGDGATAAAVSIIENDKVYYLILNLNNCDVEPSETHFLLISVDGSNTITKVIDYGPNPSANQDLM
jgi:hypothetical protein